MSAHTASSCGLSFSTQSSPPTKKKTHAEVKEDQRKRNFNYKTKLCRYISFKQKCPFEVHCLYLHSTNFEEYYRDKQYDSLDVSLPIRDFEHRKTEQLEAMLEERRVLGNHHPDWPPPQKSIHEQDWLRQCILRKLINERREEEAKEREEMNGMDIITLRNFLKL